MNAPSILAVATTLPAESTTQAETLTPSWAAFAHAFLIHSCACASVTSGKYYRRFLGGLDYIAMGQPRLEQSGSQVVPPLAA